MFSLKSMIAAVTAPVWLIGAAGITGGQTIEPGDGRSLEALGHTWTFAKIQDAHTGFAVLEDGRATSLHGIVLSWDGKTLVLTDHHPYPFNPATGELWSPPPRSINLNDVDHPVRKSAAALGLLQRARLLAHRFKEWLGLQ